MFSCSNNEKVEEYAAQHSLRLLPSQVKLLERTNKLGDSYMMTSPTEMQLLQNLCRAIGAKRTLEVGVYTGFSALSIALALPDGGEVHACDITDSYLKRVDALEIWKEANVSDKIIFHLNDAVTSLESLLKTKGNDSFDYCYIDADKGNCLQYYDYAMKLVRPGGIIAVDNTLWLGSVIDPSCRSGDTERTRALNRLIAKDERVNVSFLTIRDGVTLCFKK